MFTLEYLQEIEKENKGFIHISIRSLTLNLNTKSLFQNILKKLKLQIVSKILGSAQTSNIFRGN